MFFFKQKKISDLQLHGKTSYQKNGSAISVKSRNGIYESLISWKLNLSANEVVLIDAEIVEGEAAFVLFPKSFVGDFSNQEEITGTKRLLLIPDTFGSCHLVLRSISQGQCTVIIKNILVEHSRNIPQEQLTQGKVNRHPYWHYDFDFGNGVHAKANIPGISDSHILNAEALNALITKYFDDSVQSITDFGCSQGYYAFEYAKRGLRVKGIDNDPSVIAQALLVKEHIYNELDVHFEIADVQECPNAPTDLVHCSGLLYHLKDLIGACENIYNNCTRGAVISSFVIEHEGNYIHVHDRETKKERPFNGSYEFALVPTSEVLAKCFKEVGFSEIHFFKSTDIFSDADLNRLSGIHPKIFRDNLCYFALIK